MGSLFLISFLILAQEQTTPNAATPEQTATEAEQKPAEPIPAQSPGEILHPAATKKLPSTGEKIVSNFWTDQKAIWTSPFHMNRKDATRWALFGAGTAALIATDRRTSTALPNGVRQVGFSSGVSRIGAVYTTLPIAGALYLYGKEVDDPHAREAGVLGSEALLDSFIVSSILKFGAGRERPDAAGGKGRFFKNERSFPSGHAMMTWSFASLISHEYKGGKVVPTIAYSLATIVSVSRFTARKHFASDIVVGGSMGWFMGKYVFDHHLDPAIHKRFDPNKSNGLFPEISPSLNPIAREYALSLAWHP